MPAIKKIFFIPDVHVPHHDAKAFRLCMKALQAFRPDKVVVLGDFLDAGAVSTFPKRPGSTPPLNDEVQQSRGLLSRIVSVGGRVGCSEYVFCEGNHEDRLRRYMWQQAPAVNALTPTMEEILSIEQWLYVPYGEFHIDGRLAIAHDFGKGGKYSAANTINKLMMACVFGHYHNGNMFCKNTASGGLMMGMCCGWLGGAVDYGLVASKAADWRQGFGTAVLSTDGTPLLQFHPIYDHRCVMGGEVLSI